MITVFDRTNSNKWQSQQIKKKFLNRSYKKSCKLKRKRHRYIKRSNSYKTKHLVPNKIATVIHKRKTMKDLQLQLLKIQHSTSCDYHYEHESINDIIAEFVDDFQSYDDFGQLYFNSYINICVKCNTAHRNIDYKKEGSPLYFCVRCNKWVNIYYNNYAELCLVCKHSFYTFTYNTCDKCYKKHELLAKMIESKQNNDKLYNNYAQIPEDVDKYDTTKWNIEKVYLFTPGYNTKPWTSSKWSTEYHVRIKCCNHECDTAILLSGKWDDLNSSHAYMRPKLYEYIDTEYGTWWILNNSYNHYEYWDMDNEAIRDITHIHKSYFLYHQLRYQYLVLRYLQKRSHLHIPNEIKHLIFEYYPIDRCINLGGKLIRIYCYYCRKYVLPKDNKRDDKKYIDKHCNMNSDKIDEYIKPCIMCDLKHLTTSIKPFDDKKIYSIRPTEGNAKSTHWICENCLKIKLENVSNKCVGGCVNVEWNSNCCDWSVAKKWMEKYKYKKYSLYGIVDDYYGGVYPYKLDENSFINIQMSETLQKFGGKCKRFG